MARKRAINAIEDARDEALINLPVETQLVITRVRGGYCDDYGFFVAQPEIVKGQVMPGQLAESMEIHLKRAADAGFWRLFIGTNGKAYGHIRGFCEEQKVYHPTPSKIVQYDPEFVSARAQASAAAKALPPAPPKPAERPKTVTIGPTEADCIEIFKCYPYHVQPTKARKAIRAAFMREMNEGRSFEEAKHYLKTKTIRFANSYRGQRGRYTPYPANWFNDGSYNDPPESWDEPVAKEKPAESYKDRQRRSRRSQEPGINPDSQAISNDEAQANALAYWKKQQGKPIYRDCPANIKQILEGTPPKAQGAR